MAGEVIGADRPSVTDQIVSLIIPETVITGLRQGPVAGRSSILLADQAPSLVLPESNQIRRPVIDAESAVIKQRNLPIRVPETSQGGDHLSRRGPGRWSYIVSPHLHQ